jgi:hypothetical protein
MKWSAQEQSDGSTMWLIILALMAFAAILLLMAGCL